MSISEYEQYGVEAGPPSRPHMAFEIEFPPTTGNHQYYQSGKRRVLKPEVRTWREAVALTLDSRYRLNLTCPLKVIYFVCWPKDGRRRGDLGNIEKLVSDCLEEAQVFANDRQIRDLRTVGHDVTDGAGRIVVQVWKLW